MGHVCWALPGTTSHQSVGQGGFPDAPSAQQHDPAAARDDGCRSQVSIVAQDRSVLVGPSQLQGQVGVTFAKAHTIQLHKGPRVRSHGPGQCGTAVITDVVINQAAMYTPQHDSHYSFITKPNHTRCTYTAQTICTSPPTPTHSCLQTYTSLPIPNMSLAPCHIRIQTHTMCLPLHCIVPTKH
jgi:hypothetical protein